MYRKLLLPVMDHQIDLHIEIRIGVQQSSDKAIAMLETLISAEQEFGEKVVKERRDSIDDEIVEPVGTKSDILFIEGLIKTDGARIGKNATRGAEHQITTALDIRMNAMGKQNRILWD